MIRIIIMLSLLSAVFCQYPRERAPPLSQNPQQRPQSYQQPPPPTYEDDDYDYRPQQRNNVIYKPAPVHYVNIGAELAGDYKFGYDTGKADNGQSFREETRLPDGTVQGAYGYVDETGKQRIVKYTAGKEGFKVVSDAGSDEDKKPRSNPQPRQSAPRQTYSQPEVHQQAYRQPQQAYNPPQPQQAYRPSNQQAYNPPQQTYRPPQQVSRAQPIEYTPSSQPQRSYAPEPQAYAPEPQSYAPEPQAYAPEPQRYAPEPQHYAPEPQSYAPRSTSRSRAGSRYVPEPASRSQDGEEDYDYPDNEISERRLAPIDTSLLNYNIGTSSGGHA